MRDKRRRAAPEDGRGQEGGGKGKKKPKLEKKAPPETQRPLPKKGKQVLKTCLILPPPHNKSSPGLTSLLLYRRAVLISETLAPSPKRVWGFLGLQSEPGPPPAFPAASLGPAALRALQTRLRLLRRRLLQRRNGAPRREREKKRGGGLLEKGGGAKAAWPRPIARRQPITTQPRAGRSVSPPFHLFLSSRRMKTAEGRARRAPWSFLPPHPPAASRSFQALVLMIWLGK